MSAGLIQFEEFSLDCDRYELLRSGRPIKLEIESWDLDAVLQMAAETPSVLADGLARVATAIQSSPMLRQRIENFCRRDQR